MRCKQVVCCLVLLYLDTPQLGIQQNLEEKNNRYAQFWFFRNVSGNSFSITFCEWFLKKKKYFDSLKLKELPYILLTNQMSLSVCLYFLRYWTICTLLLFPCCEIINFEINLTFLIKSFFCITKKSWQTFKYLENKKSFWTWNNIFHHFKRVFSSQNCVRHESASLNFSKLQMYS